MNRTLKGFLKRYCTELSGLDTSSLRKLCMAAQENARLVEPLFFLAVVQGKEDYLATISAGAWFHDDYKRLASAAKSYDSAQSFMASNDLPSRYAAVYEAFEAQGDELAADRRMNGLLRLKILESLEKSGVTRYRLCKDLGLNFGNVYAYLVGDDTKVAYATAKRMLAYAQSLE